MFIPLSRPDSVEAGAGAGVSLVVVEEECGVAHPQGGGVLVVPDDVLHCTAVPVTPA